MLTIILHGRVATNLHLIQRNNKLQYLKSTVKWNTRKGGMPVLQVLFSAMIKKTNLNPRLTDWKGRTLNPRLASDIACFALCCAESLSLCDPTDCSPPGSSIPGILQARILEWVAASSSRGFSRPRDQTHVSWTAGGLFTVWTTRETHR